MSSVRNPFLFFCAAILSFCFAACSSTQTRNSNTNTGETNGNGSASERSISLDDTNTALGNLSYAPHGRGFDYKATGIDPADFQTWASQAKPKIQQALDQVGQGFVLQVTGHTCSIGPRDAVPAQGKKGNIWYSTERARAVFTALVNSGIPAARITIKGIADDESLPGIPGTDQRNRRVTFKVVPASAQ